MPRGVTFLGQVLWGSIGWAGGAVMGAALAAKMQNDRRVVLFTGEGSWMLSIQEIVRSRP
jgi:pyruvate decarboxylase